MIAICVGHSRPGDGGAVSVGGVSERFANGLLAKQIRAKLEAHDIECEVIDSYQGGNYSAAMRWLGRKLTTLQATGALELHFNFAEAPAHGHEWLHWHASVGGRYLAQALNRSMTAAFPDHKARGLVPVVAKGRGEGFLRCTPCPAVIAEPYFGSNPQEWAWVKANQHELAQAMADGVAAWAGGPK
jgi:N-acetylmuramoyl-L-alanine amidase